MKYQSKKIQRKSKKPGASSPARTGPLVGILWEDLPKLLDVSWGLDLIESLRGRGDEAPPDVVAAWAQALAGTVPRWAPGLTPKDVLPTADRAVRLELEAVARLDWDRVLIVSANAHSEVVSEIYSGADLELGGAEPWEVSGQLEICAGKLETLLPALGALPTQQCADIFEGLGPFIAALFERLQTPAMERWEMVLGWSALAQSQTDGLYGDNGAAETFGELMDGFPLPDDVDDRRVLLGMLEGLPEPVRWGAAEATKRLRTGK